MCDQLSPRCFEVVRAQIEAGYVRFITDLRFKLLDVADIFGVALPEAEQWRKERREEEDRVAARLKMLEDYGRHSRKRKRKDAEPFAGLSKEQPSPPQEDDWSSEEATKEVHTTETPYRRTQPKVGRNDPCPCGSGKKYKKCCGKLQ